MTNTKEKLIELLNNSFDEQYGKRGLLTAPHTADHLIANGVTVQKHGRWVKDEEESKNHIEAIYVCSACRNCEAWGATEKTNYCPNCGAKMDLK